FASVTFFLFKDHGTTQMDTVESSVNHVSDSQLTEAQDMLDKFEKKPSEKLLKDVELALNKLSNSSKKEALQKRFKKAKDKYLKDEADKKATKDATDLVEILEQAPSEENVLKAEAAVNKLTVKESKEALQKRIDTVKTQYGLIGNQTPSSSVAETTEQGTANPASQDTSSYVNQNVAPTYEQPQANNTPVTPGVNNTVPTPGTGTVPATNGTGVAQ
ncbi:peptidase, partial [Streptococcus agalactiae]|nr:peptidase [Streptococcus agalactiae]MCC9699914.1 peptidase [Streptococcus agalactiae]MCC9771912.1 peptidase [Streptococcus agalactiae]MCD0015468.1 peptidase [Streptococcus agalactiae]MCD0050574.1 peptidase [Streptococcus agalactiae]